MYEPPQANQNEFLVTLYKAFGLILAWMKSNIESVISLLQIGIFISITSNLIVMPIEAAIAKIWTDTWASGKRDTEPAMHACDLTKGVFHKEFKLDFTLSWT